MHEDGAPFFFLGDTAWELFHRLTKEEAEFYFQDRAKKKYTVIQAVVLAEFGGLNIPNAYGHKPLHDNDPTKPVEEYFAHVDWITKKANSLGLVMGILPTWGDKWNRGSGEGPEIFSPENAETYGEFLGKRYTDDDIVWILGGDRTVENDNQKEIIRSMAKGLRKGDNGKHLISFHPGGPHPYSSFFHEDDWLDFNMIQSSHVGKDKANYEMIEKDYNRTPPKPCMDDEPCYEDHPVMTPEWKTDAEEYFDDCSVRKRAYWSLFAGSHGFTYGAHPVWQMWDENREPINNVRRTWKEALELPGSYQMQYVRQLMESRAFFARIPDQSLLISEPGPGGEHVRATRDADGTYAFVYIPAKQEVTIDLTRLKSDKLKASWFNPRTGKTETDEDFENTGQKTFASPDNGPDWVLIIDAM